MNIPNRNILLAIAVVLIVGAIWYIEASKPPIVVGTSVAISATSTTATLAATIVADQKAGYAPAVELIPGGDPSATGTTPFGAPASSGFINTTPFKLKDLIGKKVILIDFWTYSCINCLRAQPYLNAWYQKYKGQGLVIIGIESPEFDFEKNYNNVVQAIANQYHIQYPVVEDNNLATWNAYQNQYWPADYLIDIAGYVTDTHFGEGDYAATESKIQAALTQRDQVLNLPDTVPTGTVNPSNAITVSANGVQSPETYFGAARNEFLGNGTQSAVGVQQLIAPSTTQLNTLYLDGTWNFQDQYASNQAAGAKIIYEYNSKNVYMVATASKPVKLTILIDGKPISATMRGADVATDGTVTVQENRLYNLVEGSDYGERTLEIIVNSPGLDAYTFTFG